MTNDNTITVLTPERAAETLAHMIAQLEGVIEKVDSTPTSKQADEDTKQRALSDMHMQLEAMKHGKAAIIRHIERWPNDKEATYL